MSLLVAEGFDELNTPLLNKQYLWSGAYVLACPYVAQVAGRYHGRAFAGGNPREITWVLDTTLSEIYVALAVKRTGTGTDPILAFMDGTSYQTELRPAGAGAVDLAATRNGTLLGTVSGFLPLNVWKWLSIRVVISDAAGVVEVRDAVGTVLLNLTGVDTKNTSNASANRVYFGKADVHRDDLFVMSTAGSSFKGHLTERAIYSQFLTGDGAETDYDPHGAANRWDCVDEIQSDGDTTYIDSDTVGDQYLGTAPAMPAAYNGIEGVIQQHRSRKDDVGARSIAALIKSGATEANGVTRALISDYISCADLWELNPDTSAAWSRATVDALQRGVETKV